MAPNIAAKGTHTTVGVECNLIAPYSGAQHNLAAPHSGAQHNLIAPHSGAQHNLFNPWTDLHVAQL